VSHRPTSAQQRVIDERGHLLVVAGPGSGKTSTIVGKIGAICSSVHTRVVAVTFTRDSAQEMEKRVGRDLDRAVMSRVTIGTFHSLTLRHLETCKRKPRVASPGQQRSFLMRCIDALPSDDRPWAFQLFEQAKCSLEPRPDITDLPWFRTYQQTLARNGLVDLYDVMRDTTACIASGELPTLPCTHLIVDEAQDCDAIQFTWTRAHTARGIITTLVGDDDQTIYEWRRAIGYPGMRAFAEEFEATVVPLGENFRSLGTIVESAVKVISNNNPLRLRKDLVARRGTGGIVQLLSDGSTRACARVIAEMIRDNAERIDDAEGRLITHDVPTGSWAVLARSHFAINLMQAALDGSGIRNFRNGGSIYETPVANVYLSLLSTLQTDDPVGLELGMLHAGISPAASGAVLQGHRGCLGELMDRGADFARFGPLQMHLDAFFKRVKVWRRFAREGAYIDVIDRVAQFVIASARDSEREAAIAICGAIFETLQRFGDRPLHPRVGALQQRMARRDPERAVALYTLHGSKGLEFDNVVLLGMDDGSIPGDVVRLGSGAGTVANVASERRLFYVGMTRAKNRLFISHTAGRASRFIQELPSSVRAA
jgi:superfamily I DNA/RNA helicase